MLPRCWNWQIACLDDLGQVRDDALADFDAANNAATLSFLALRSMVLALPQAAEGELSEDLPAESELLDLLDPAYGIKPRTAENAIARGRILVSAMTRMNAYLAGLPIPRAPITSGGLGLINLSSALSALPLLQQTEENSAADVQATRTGLRVPATGLDRLNKRFYSRVKAEPRTNPALAQITTGGDDLPGTLGIAGILQGGANSLSLLVSYESGTFHDEWTNTLEWMVVGADLDFTHSNPADPSGNTLGPFAVGQTVKLRTRVTNANGTTTGSVRTLLIVAN